MRVVYCRSPGREPIEVELTEHESILAVLIMARGLVKQVVGRRTHFTEVENIFEDIVSQKLLGRGALTYE